ncbi:hypothetical protein GDO86_016375 [Hymenochirus boettgeri]|uniref:Uncharacterized protein n=1 Tax=Hymenochirus boettgeri TaxID=247094 RepID=A0A8T2K111_9PIPI|nr:hypothetical protein GDO86_016375 [Hymenochirus boettgeri]
MTLELKIEDLQVQFESLQKAAEDLDRRLALQVDSVVSEERENETWTSPLENRFTTREQNLLYSYTVDAVGLLHYLVRQQLPDLEKDLPTLASILKLKSRNGKIKQAYSIGLKTMNLSEEDVNALCTFLITCYYEAQYLPQEARNESTEGMNHIIDVVIKNQAMQRSFKIAVLAVEKGKTLKGANVATDV